MVCNIIRFLLFCSCHDSTCRDPSNFGVKTQDHVSPKKKQYFFVFYCGNQVKLKHEKDDDSLVCLFTRSVR